MNNIKDEIQEYSRKIYEIAFILRANKCEPGEISLDNLISALSADRSTLKKDIKSYYETLLKIAVILKTNGYNSKALTIEDLLKILNKK